MKEKRELNEQTKGIEGFSHDYKTNQFLIKAQFATLSCTRVGRLRERWTYFYVGYQLLSFDQIALRLF